MKAEIKDLEPCRRELVISAPAEETADDYTNIVKMFVSAGRIKGFRKGKAPVGVVERNYRNDIVEEAQRTLVPKMYHEALEQAGISPVSVVSVHNVEFSKESGLSFNVIVDVAPEFKLPKYMKIGVKSSEVSVDESDVQSQFEKLMGAFARYEDITEGTVDSGFMAQIDYSAVCGKKPLAEVAGDCSELAGGTDFWALAAEPEFIPGVAVGLIGMAIGETRTIDVKFAKDFQVEAVQGKKATYTVTVKAIRKQIMPELNEEFFERLGVDDEGALRERMRGDMTEQANVREVSRQRDEVAEYLLKKTEFELPKTIVDEETRLTVRSIVNDIVRQGGTREQLEQQQQTILETATQASTNRVRLRYILTRIADEEKIETTDEEVEARLDQLSQQYRMPKPQLKKELEERNSLDNLINEVRTNKTLDFLLAEAKLK